MRTHVAPPVLDRLTLDRLDDADPSVLAEDAVLDGLHVVGTALEGRSLAGMSVSECVLDGLALHDSGLARARFNETRIRRLDVAALDAAHSAWRSCELEGCRIGSAELFDSSWQSVRLTDCKLGYLNLRGAQFHDILFTGCRIEELDLQGATARRVAFDGCQVRTLSLRQATLQNVDLRGAALREIEGVEHLRGTVISPEQLFDLAPLLAAHAGIRVE